MLRCGRARVFCSATCACSPRRRVLCPRISAAHTHSFLNPRVSHSVAVQVVGGWSSGTGMSGVSGAALYFAMSQAGLSNSTIFFTQATKRPRPQSSRVQVSPPPPQIITSPIFMLVFLWVQRNEPAAPSVSISLQNPADSLRLALLPAQDFEGASRVTLIAIQAKHPASPQPFFRSALAHAPPPPPSPPSPRTPQLQRSLQTRSRRKHRCRSS